MKKQLFLFLFLLITGVGICRVSAQSMAIRMQDGSEETIGLSTLGKITFSNSNLLVNQATGTTESFSLSNIRKIYFKSLPTGTDENQLTGNTNSLFFYPNPVNNIIYLTNIPENISIVKIYRMDGTLILQKQISSNNISLDVSMLGKGFYFISFVL